MSLIAEATQTAVENTMISEPIVTLAAVVVGSLITYLVAKGGQRVQIQHEKDMQWFTEIKSNYVKFLGLIEKISSAKELAANSPNFVAKAKEMKVAIEKMERLRTTFSLIASNETLKAADGVITASKSIAGQVEAKHVVSLLQTKELDNKAAAMTSAVRKNLGVAG